MSITSLAWMILWLPFVVAVSIMFVFKPYPKISGWLATGAMISDFLLTLTIFSRYHALNGSQPFIESSIPWISLSTTNIEFGILLNGLTLLMLLIVTGIGSLIFLYSMSYMEHEEGYSRYFASLALFAFSMLGIVLSNNLIQIFIFWELVGVSSYLLIGFWFEKKEAATAGKKAFLTTRVGDVGMMIGILILFGLLLQRGLGTFNFVLLETYIPQAHLTSGILTVISLLMFMGVMGKSAQLPLHVWLPDAMEGPTPVSALIHAATMVAAGVFLLARLSFLFNLSPSAMHIIAWIGTITALMAGTIALVQDDIKKILAYSTLSQLGYMVMALGLGHVEAGMFHLTTHAFFKALLFLGAGSLIHALHTQNIWEMPTEKGLIREMPVTSITFLLGTFALMGIPPLSGYFSKEEILAAAHSNSIIFIMAMTTVFFTAFYMGRLCTLVFFRPAPKHDKHDPHSHHHAHEAGWKITVPLLILGIFSVIAGFLPIKKLISSGEVIHEASHPSYLAAMSLTLAISGFVLAFFLFYKKKHSTKGGAFTLPQIILQHKYFFDDLYDALILYVQENIARLSDLFERIVMVETGMNGTARNTAKVGDILRKLQTGVVQFYALVFAIGVTAGIYFIVVMGKS